MQVAVFGSSNLRYFTGAASLSGILLASRQGEWLIAGDTDLAQTTGISVVKPGRSPQDELLRLLKQQKVRRLGIDMKNISHDLHTKLVSARIRPVDVGDRLRQMRAVKSGAEIRSIREACRLADRAMDAACGSIRDRKSVV